MRWFSLGEPADETAQLEPGAGHAAFIEEVDFGNGGEWAVDAHTAKERGYHGLSTLDIFLVRSDTIEAVRITHADYSGGPARMTSKHLVDI